MSKRGFPWTPTIEQAICDLLVGGASMHEIAKEPWAPSEATIYRRMASDDNFATKIANARAAQQDAEIEKCVQMADEATPENWQVVKMRIWARQWRASKLAPKKYGDQQNINLTGQVDVAATIRAARRRSGQN